MAILFLHVNNNLSGLIVSDIHEVPVSKALTSQYTCYINSYERISINTIHVTLALYYDIECPIGTDIAYLPQHITKKIPCMIRLNDNWMPAYCLVNQGIITQDWSDHCTGICIDTLIVDTPWLSTLSYYIANILQQ